MGKTFIEKMINIIKEHKEVLNIPCSLMESLLTISEFILKNETPILKNQ